MPRGPSPYDPKRRKDLNFMAAHLGVDRDDFQEEDTGSQGAFDHKGFEKAILRASANNYDYRRSTEAATLAGEKDVPTSFENIDDAREIYHWMKDQHGGGGKFSSAQDYANITERMVKLDRSTITNKIDELSNQMLEQAKEKKEAKVTNKGPVVMSDRLSSARDTVDNAETDQEAATASFTDGYKLDLASGLELQEDKEKNLSNAASTVTDTYGR